MNDVVKDFDASLCFVGPNSLLSNLETLVVYPSNQNLSKLLVYMSVMLRYPNMHVAVDKEYHSLLKKVFSSPLFASGDSEDALVISELSGNGKDEKTYRAGEVLMPVFVPASSTKVYNIHRAEAPLTAYTQEVIAGALNFFNYVVRDNKVGIARIVWRDPVMGNTILKEESYDEMFALHVADSYLRTIDPQYPYDRPLYNLSMCVRTVDVLKELTAYGVSFRAISEEMTRAIVIPWPPIVSDRGYLAPDPRIAVDVDEVNKELFSLLYFAFIAKLDKKEAFTLVITGFKKYSHLLSFVGFFPNCHVDVWGELPAAIASSKIISRGKTLTALDLSKRYPAKSSCLISGHTPPISDRLTKNFTGRWMSTNDGSAKYKPVLSFIPCFSSAKETRECCIFGAVKQSSSPAERADHKASVLRTASVLNEDMRDLKRWQYFIPKNEDLKMSYDKAVLHTLIEAL